MKQVMGAYTRTEHFNLLSLEKKKSIRNLQKKLKDTSTTGKKNILLSYEFVSGLPNSSSGFRGINFEKNFLDYNLNGYKQVPMAYSLDIFEINELFFLYKILPIDVDIIPKTVDGFARSARGSFEHDTLHNKKIADKMTMTTRELHAFYSNFEKIKALAKNKEESTMAEVLLFNLWHEKYCMDLSKGSHCWAALESLRTKTDIDFRILINDVPELKQIVKDEAKVRAMVGATLDLITNELK
jgi:hypothetical protein